MYSKWIDISLYTTVFLSGLYGGIGFFNFLGGTPAIEKLSTRGFAEYWQRIDSFMGARMPVFGPVLLLSVALSAILLVKEWKAPAFWLMVLALLVLAGDIVFTLSVNHPLNRLIQSWDLNSLPANEQEIQMKVAHAFNIRSWFMIISFAMTVLAAFFRKVI
jgi:uncharacterized membrane protein